jgi:hypothetical protein
MTDSRQITVMFLPFAGEVLGPMGGSLPHCRIRPRFMTLV